VSGAGDPRVECQRLNAIIADVVIDVAFIGIGQLLAHTYVSTIR